ncbi:MAG: NADPH:quinone reductase [Mycobacteriales bacterium]|jgi:NADPH2:quinone reductase
MRAVLAREPGPPEVLRPVDLPDPVPGPGQVVVAVDVAGIAFIETQIRAGNPPGPSPAFPLVPGNCVAGTVDAVGAGVDRGWLGTQVVTSTGGSGGYASRALAAAADLHRIPSGLSLPAAAAVLADGRTALGLAHAAGIKDGDVVAVTAAGGGVGSLLVQLATQAGATVIALAGSEPKLALARSLGADAAVDYRHPDWPALLTAAAPGGLDVVFDGVAGDVTGPLFTRAATGGRYLSHGVASGARADLGALTAARLDVTLIPLGALAADQATSFALTDDALARAAAGTLRPTIGQTYPLADAAAAHAAIEGRTTLGKTLLIP